MKKHAPVTITIPADRWERLVVLGKPEEVVGMLVNHACVGINSPGTWQRLWVCQAFCDDLPQEDLVKKIQEIYAPVPTVRKAVGE